MNKIKVCIGPMSKNVVDCVIDICNEYDINVGMIPSRRQIEFDGGYVNNWNTKEFSNYIREKTNKITLIRDHGGPLQGNIDDDGYESINDDLFYFDIIHIDVWKKYQPLEIGLKKTIELIEYCYSINSNVMYEVGTEESIRKFNEDELNFLLSGLKLGLKDEIFSKIKYCVIQSGTSLEMDMNTGEYSPDRLKRMIDVVKSYGLLTKEHNGDYISNDIINDKIKIGLDCINIAPEFGRMETTCYLEKLSEKEKEKFYEICLESNKWVKWVNGDFIPSENKELLIKICGHYVFSNPNFKEIVINIDIYDELKCKIKNKILNIVN